MNINKNEIINKLSLKTGPNNKLLREYKMKLNNLSLELWEISIGLMLGHTSLQT